MSTETANQTSRDVETLHVEELLEDTQKNKYLTFMIDDEEYGLEIFNITEIIGIESITQVPHTPNFVKGVINLRGSVIPVLEVRIRFRKPEAEYTDRTCIVVATYKDIVIGLIVDSVNEVAAIPQEFIQPPPNAKAGYHNKFIKNVGKVDDKMKLLLDLSKLLNDEE